jgi:hypothetical protein
MNTTRYGIGLLAAGVMIAGVDVQGHEHLNTGATGQAQGDQLIFANGDEFAASSGYKQEMTYASDGPYAGHYASEITFTVLAATVDFGGPTAGAPSLGSFIQTRIESVQGPAGGTFSFWNEDETIPGIQVPAGSATPSALWAVSDEEDHIALGLAPAGSPGADPYGHVHGTQFTVDVPGTYTVGFRLFDTSDNGLNGGPIHTPSDVLYINFVTVPEPGALTVATAGIGALLLRAGRRAGAGRA